MKNYAEEMIENSYNKILEEIEEYSFLYGKLIDKNDIKDLVVSAYNIGYINANKLNDSNIK